MTEQPQVPPPTSHPPIPPPPPGSPAPGYPPPGYPAPWSGPPAYGYAAFPRNSGRAIAVFVLGITSLVFLCGYGIGAVTAVIGLVLAPGARREIDASGGRVIGDGLLRAGVICCWVAVGLTVVGILAVILFIAGGVAFFPSDPAAATP